MELTPQEACPALQGARRNYGVALDFGGGSQRADGWGTSASVKHPEVSPGGLTVKLDLQPLGLNRLRWDRRCPTGGLGLLIRLLLFGFGGILRAFIAHRVPTFLELPLDHSRSSSANPCF